jgi:hypothetical protein
MGVPNPKSATTQIIVHILDVNDNSPVFPTSGYDITVKEGDTRREILKVGLHKCKMWYELTTVVI